MIVKVAAFLVLVGVCFAVPFKETTYPRTQVAIDPIRPSLTKLEVLHKPPHTDQTDLKTDASTWWYHEVPVYPVYHVHTVPYYTYWPTHW